MHLRWSATPTISSPLYRTDTSRATHTLSWRGPVSNQEPCGSYSDALMTELNRPMFLSPCTKV